MREILNIQIGQCGGAIGNQFWEILCADHGLNSNGLCLRKIDVRLERINVYFKELRGLRYTPRSVMIDLDKSSIETVRTSSIGQIFKPDNFIFGSAGTGNNWAKGHFSEGVNLCNTSLNLIRKEVEACDCFYGFQIVHSIGGGTGGGLGSLLLDRLQEAYPGTMKCTYSVIPSLKVSSFVVEPYNAILTMNYLIDYSDQTYCVDNEALNFIATNTLKIGQVTYCDLNYLIALVMTGITTSLRFPGPSNSSLKKIAVNMTPFPRLHFFVPSFAPLVSRRNKPYQKFSVGEIISQIFDHKNLFAACNTKLGKFLTVACLFRGDISTREVDLQMYNIQNKESSAFVEWIPNNIKTSICSSAFPGVNKTATFVGNTTAIQDLFKRLNHQFETMFKSKAFVHWFTDEGLEELEFHEAAANIKDLTAEYKEYQDAEGVQMNQVTRDALALELPLEHYRQPTNDFMF